MFAVNGRFVAHRPTGMQKYAASLLARFQSAPQIISPSSPLKGIQGHLWEQSVLPVRVPGGLLWSPCGTGPLAMADQVVTIHDIIPIERPDWFSRSFAALHLWLVPRLVQRVRHVITVSEFTRHRLIERFGIRPDRVTAVPNGVGEEYYRRSAEEIVKMRRDLSIPDGEYVLSVCSLEPRKNLLRLLEAWQLVQPRYPATLVVAGAKGASGVFKDAGINNVAPRVHFTGYVPEEQLPTLYSGASCFAYPSLYEGFGLPVLEALACGVPVVTSNTTSLPEVSGPAAQLVDPERIDQIADVILEVLQNPDQARRLGETGQSHARQFSWATCARKTESLLLSLR